MHPVIVEFFSSHGCPQCTVVRNEILPAARSRYADLIQIIERDISIERDASNVTNLLALLDAKQRLNCNSDGSVALLLDKKVCLTMCRYFLGKHE